MSKPKSRRYKTARKNFDEDLYREGLKAESAVMQALAQYGANYMDGCEEGNFEVLPNPDKYGIDLLVIDKKSKEPLYGVEVMKRTSITYPTIYVESNKSRFYKTGLAILVIVINSALTSALVLNCDKNISDYPLVTTNYNKDQTDEDNFHIPRKEFIPWDLK